MGAFTLRNATCVGAGAAAAFLSGAGFAQAQEAAFKPRARIQFDIVSSDWDTQADEGAYGSIRRAFLGGQGRLSEHWRYKADFVLTPDTDAIFDDAYLEYDGGSWSVLIGEHKIATPLEDQTSSLDLSFNESVSFVSAFGYGRRAGVGAIVAGDNWSAAAAVQGDSLNSLEGGETNSDALYVSSRVTYAPVLHSGEGGLTLVHLGASTRFRELGDESPQRYRARPLNGRGARWIDAGSGLGGERDFSYGIEAALQRGRFGAQAEYVILDGDSVAGADFTFSGYYVDLFWSLTGESRNYRAGTGSFGAVRPSSPVTEGGPGHWMLAARYDFLDLSDSAGGASRGEQSAYALGLDWVPVRHVRFKLNYAVSDMDRTLGPDESAQIVSFRTQLDY